MAVLKQCQAIRHGGGIFIMLSYNCTRFYRIGQRRASQVLMGVAEKGVLGKFAGAQMKL
jgi:hypothetical protein